MFNRRNRLVAFAALLAVAVAVAGTVAYFTMARGEAVVTGETENYLAELSEQTTQRINLRMQFNLQTLENVGSQLEIMADNEEARVAAINAVVESSPFVWIGYTDYEGNLTVPGHGTIDASDQDSIVQALEGDPGVSSMPVKVFDDQYGVLYAAPAPGANSVGSVVGWIPIDQMELLFDTDTTEGVGFTHIVSSNGQFILHSENANALLLGDNLFDSLQELTDIDPSDLAVMERDLLQGAAGHLAYTIDGGAREMNYRPLDEGGWFAVSIVPPQAYTRSLTDFISGALLSMAALAVALFALFGAYLLWTTGKANRQIERIAFVDPVTGGHSGARFDQLMSARLEEGRPFMLVALDVSNFRLFNEQFGKNAGDRLLKHVHDSIKAHLGQGEAVARLSADVFNIMLDETDREKVRARLRSVADAVNAFNASSDTPYLVKLDCGVLAVEEGLDIVVARDRANTARKSADVQTDQLCSVSFFSDVEHDRLMREKEMENSMERALADGEFVVHLQPKISLETGEAVGAEALVRWDSPQRGLVPPDEFIPFFERNGFVIKVDLAVFEQVCALIRSWLDDGLKPLPVSVNLSPLHLSRPDFLAAFEEVRERYGVPAELLEFELTERVAFKSLELLRGVVDDIHARGFRCSMDDFGSGYSSLNVLKEIPVDVLKIDRQFFVGEDERAGRVVESVVELAKKLDMGTVAEGVETIPQVEFLKSVECDAVQGYVFSAPVPVELFEKMVFGSGSRGARGKA